MQALQAPEACIRDVHQRGCIRAFIVVMDGHMPNWKKLLIFSHLALWLPLENFVDSDPGRIISFLSLCITSVVVVRVAVRLHHTMSLQRARRTQAASAPPPPPPLLTCVNDSEGLQTATTHVI